MEGNGQLLYGNLFLPSLCNFVICFFIDLLIYLLLINISQRSPDYVHNRMPGESESALAHGAIVLQPEELN